MECQNCLGDEAEYLVTIKRLDELGGAKEEFRICKECANFIEFKGETV
jgi:hypothetical protein